MGSTGKGAVHAIAWLPVGMVVAACCIAGEPGPAPGPADPPTAPPTLPTPAEIASDVARAEDVAASSEMEPPDRLAAAEAALEREATGEGLTETAARLAAARGHLDALPDEFERARVRAARRNLDAAQRTMEREALRIARGALESESYDLARIALAVVPDGSRSAGERDRVAARIERAERRAAELAEARGPRPEMSWDGACAAIGVYLRMTAHDPSSIEIVRCGDLYTEGDYWTQDCSYRGTNAFGATVLNTSRFYIQHNGIRRTRPVR